MLQMKPQPSITVVSVTDKTKVAYLDDPLAGLLVFVLLHRRKITKKILTIPVFYIIFAPASSLWWWNR
jgi:hypothetical protein